MRLLLADDNPMNVEFIVAALDGHEVVVARDGTDALAAGLHERFDVVLLDIQMSGLSGIEVCRALRDAGVRTPILAVTANAMRTEASRASESGFDEYLTKPISPSALRSAVERYRAH